MITALDNQPISFQDTFLRGCLQDDPDECALIAVGDEVTLQFGYEPCLGDQLLASPNFEDAADWSGSTWSILPGNACFAGDATLPTSLTEGSLTPTVGSIYLVRMTIGNYHGGMNRNATFIVQFAGGLNTTVTVPIASPRDFQWIVTATGTAPLTISPTGPGSKGCVLKAEVYDLNPDISVFVMDGPTQVGTFDFAGSPQLFSVLDEKIVISFGFSDFDTSPIDFGCYTFVVVDNCDDTSLESMCIAYGEHPCTLVLSACNAEAVDGGRSGQGLRLSKRVVAALTHPTYAYVVSQDRRSNGYIDRHYADRRRGMELRIDGLGEMGHRFVSSLALYDHVYVDREEYVVNAEDYEPLYGDVWEARGSILLKCEPKQELARKVRCGPDEGGCQPPPNYLVTGLGPNENYLLQEDGFKILIQT